MFQVKYQINICYVCVSNAVLISCQNQDYVHKLPSKDISALRTHRTSHFLNNIYAKTDRLRIFITIWAQLDNNNSLARLQLLQPSLCLNQNYKGGYQQQSHKTRDLETQETQFLDQIQGRWFNDFLLGQIIVETIMKICRSTGRIHSYWKYPSCIEDWIIEITNSKPCQMYILLC